MLCDVARPLRNIGHQMLHFSRRLPLMTVLQCLHQQFLGTCVCGASMDVLFGVVFFYSKHMTDHRAILNWELNPYLRVIHMSCLHRIGSILAIGPQSCLCSSRRSSISVCFHRLMTSLMLVLFRFVWAFVYFCRKFSRETSGIACPHLHPEGLVH